jgi:hypothetical protein
MTDIIRFMRNETIVYYKRKRYRLLWHGPTRWGHRAHLQWLNGAKDFWADAEKVKGLPTPAPTPVESDQDDHRHIIPFERQLERLERAAGEREDNV